MKLIYQQIIILYFIAFFQLSKYFIESFTVYTKKIDITNKNCFTKWNNNRVFELEVYCLKKLKDNYNCICSKKRKHFPEIIKIYNIGNKKNIEMTNIGTSLNFLSKIERKKYKNINFDEQIECILRNLKKSGIYHADMVGYGNNMVINEEGDLGLIDFNIAFVKDKFNDLKENNNSYKESYNKHINNNYDSFKSILTNVLND